MENRKENIFYMLKILLVVIMTFILAVSLVLTLVVSVDFFICTFNYEQIVDTVDMDLYIVKFVRVILLTLVYKFIRDRIYYPLVDSF